MKKYWILSRHGVNWNLLDEFHEDNDIMAQAYFRGKCGSWGNDYQLVKVL